MRAIAICCLLLACDATVASDGSDQDYEQTVAHRASIEFGCSESEVVVTEIDHQTYLAEGCGYRATYECGIPNNQSGPNPCLRAPDLEPIDAGCP